MQLLKTTFFNCVTGVYKPTEGEVKINPPGGETQSITQLEYRYAVEHDIDVIPFCLEEDAPWPRQFDEMDTDTDEEAQVAVHRRRIIVVTGSGSL